MRRLSARRLIGHLGPDRSLTERVAMFAAVAVIGPTFEPGLQPRRTVHQAVATGLIATGTLLGVTLAQSMIEATGRAVARRGMRAGSSTDRSAEQAGIEMTFHITVNSTAAIACRIIARTMAPRDGESMRRGLLRMIADRTERVAQLTTVATALIGTAHYVEQRWPRLAWIHHTPIALPLGAVFAAWHIHRVRGRMREYNNTSLDGVAALPSLGLAAIVGVGVWTLRLAERWIALVIARTLRTVAPSSAPVAVPIGHAVSIAGFAMVVGAGYQYTIRQVEQGGSAIEPAYEDEPTSMFVSGSHDSLVSFASLSREGRRFVNMVLERSEIHQVMEEEALADPIRIFIGLAAAPTVSDRVQLAIDELERTGAFDRSVLCIASPTGSGYVNYVFAETLEYLTRGDCAIVTLQYSLRPSSLSLDRAATGIEQNTALLHAVSGYVSGMSPERRPRIVLFGESLGAQTLLDTYRNRSVTALHRDHVHASLFLGTPAATRFAHEWRRDPDRVDPEGAMIEVDSFGEFTSASITGSAARHVLLTHHDDPIPVFSPELLVRQPSWLVQPPELRPPGVPRSSRWRPGTTFVLTGVDLLNAMNVVPGHFTRRGHDYRADIPDFTRLLFAPGVDDERFSRVQDRLRERERFWARQRVVAEQISRAREAIERELQAWTVTSGTVTSGVVTGG
jgi:uncharacterized membrane protein